MTYILFFDNSNLASTKFLAMLALSTCVTFYNYLHFTSLNMLQLSNLRNYEISMGLLLLFILVSILYVSPLSNESGLLLLVIFFTLVTFCTIVGFVIPISKQIAWFTEIQYRNTTQRSLKLKSKNTSPSREVTELLDNRTSADVNSLPMLAESALIIHIQQIADQNNFESRIQLFVSFIWLYPVIALFLYVIYQIAAQ